MTNISFLREGSIQMSNKFIGEGSYGCVYLPGIDCKGKKNKKNTITKIQEINFYSSNEISIGKLIKKIKDYKLFFAPIIKSCKISFKKLNQTSLELNKCNSLFEEYYNNKDLYSNKDLNKNNVESKYYLTYIKYIKNKTFKEYFMDINLPGIYFNEFIKCYYIILNSIIKLNNANIIHNDLHINNILYNFKTNIPVIIDYGLSFNKKQCEKMKNSVDFYYIKKFVFDYRTDSYNHNIEKRFISFIIYNKSEDFYSIVQDNNTKNILTDNIINIFVEDCYDSIVKNIEIAYFFNKEELEEYKTELYKYYNKFTNKNKYPYYSNIVLELLEEVFEYNDLYFLTIDYIYIYYLKKEIIESNKYLKPLCYFFIQLFKKTLHPNPEYRIKKNEIKIIIEYLFDKINTTNINTTNANTSKNDYIKDWNSFLEKNNILLKKIYNPKFGYIDFNIILDKDIIEFIKKNNTNVKKINNSNNSKN